MRYAIISDIHANEQALKAVLADAAAKGVDRIVCLGDIVGYGPLPAETVRLARAACHIAIAGNHDDAVSGRSSADGFIGLAGDAVSRHRDALAPGDIAWLKSLPYVYEGDGFTACHGDFTDPPQFYYIEEISDAEANFKACGADLMFVGHTHVPSLFLTGASGKTYKTGPQDFTLESGKRYIVNPGSVGYPREADGKCLSSYVIFDSAEKSVTFHYLPLAISSVMQRGRNDDAQKSSRWKIIAAALAALAVIGCVTAYLAISNPPGAVSVVRSDPAIREITIPVTAELKFMRPNLELAEGSAPVHLMIMFKKTDGTFAPGWSRTVKEKCSQKIKIPSGTAEIEISVRKTEAGGDTGIVRLEPAATVN
jgi:predicted phosphodiesterase